MANSQILCYGIPQNNIIIKQGVLFLPLGVLMRRPIALLLRVITYCLHYLDSDTKVLPRRRSKHLKFNFPLNKRTSYNDTCVGGSTNTCASLKFTVTHKQSLNNKIMMLTNITPSSHT